jgi:transaldolase
MHSKALAAPFTVNTMPEGTLKALADHGSAVPVMDADGSSAEKTLHSVASAGFNVDAMSAQRQSEGATSFIASWNELLAVFASKSRLLKQPAATQAWRL